MRKAAQLARTLALAMQHAHEAGIVHRDLKPANVLLTAAGEPKIADFGLAKELQTDSGFTQTGSILGTPSYMAAEQAEGAIDQIGPRTDVYALGAILYEMLTGRPPFKGASIAETLEQVRLQDPAPPRRLRPQAPKDLETICLKCLAKKPDNRYGDAQRLAEDLDRFLLDQPIHARPVSSWERGRKLVRRHPATATSLAMSLLLMAALAIGSIAYSVQVRSYAAEVARSKDNLVTANKELAASNQGLKTATDRALKNEGIAKAARARAERERDQARLELARREREEALALCQEGDANMGLHYLARSLESAPADAREFRRSVLINSEAWLSRVFVPTFKAAKRAAGAGGAAAGDARQLLLSLQDLENLDQVGNVLAIDPESKTAVTKLHDGEAQLWSVTRDEAIGPRLPRLARVDRGWCYRADGKAVLIMCVDGAHLLDTAAGEQIGSTLNCLDAGAVLQSFAMSPDGKVLHVSSLSRRGFPVHKLWDLAAQKEIGSLHHLHRGASWPTFSPDSKTLAIGASRGVHLWDVATQAFIGDVGAEPVRLTSFSRDGKRLLTLSRHGNVRLWDVATLRRTASLENAGVVLSATFADDGQAVITGDQANTVRMWDAATGEPLSAPLRHRGRLRFLSSTDKGPMVLSTNGGESSVTLWSKAGDPELVAQQSELSHQAGQWLEAAGFSSDGGRLVAGAGLWDAQDSLLLRRFTGRVKGLTSDGSEVVTLGGGHDLRRWDTETGKPLGPLMKFKTPSLRLAVRRGGPMLRVSHRCLDLCDISGRITSLQGDYYDAEFLPDGARFLACARGKVSLFDTTTAKPIKHFEFPGVAATVAIRGERRLAVAPAGDKFIVGGDGIRLWDMETGEHVDLLPYGANGSVCNSVVFSPDGKLALTGGADGTARLWDAETGKQIGRPWRHGREVMAVAFAPQGDLAATLGGTAVQLWDVATGTEVGPPIGHATTVIAMAFHPQGSSILSVSTRTKLTPVPRPPPDDAAQVKLRVQAITGVSLSNDELVRPIEPDALRKLRRKAGVEHLTASESIDALAKELQQDAGEANPLTWQQLLGVPVARPYPTEPLSLVAGLNRSRGEWGFSGSLEREGESADFEADLLVQGGFEKGKIPGWLIKLSWPNSEPQQALTISIVLLFAPESDAIRLSLFSSHVQDGERPRSARRRTYSSKWDAENRTLTGYRKVLQPGKPARTEEFQIVVQENGELQIRDFSLGDGSRVSGKTGARNVK